MEKTKTKKKDSGISVEETIKSLRKKYGDDSIMKLNQKPLVGLESFSTGSFGLDIALGIGGFPQGRIVEIFGPESSGKTTLALHTVAEAQKKGGLCCYIDAEHAMDPEYAKRLGVKTDELLISQPSYGEQALDMVEGMVQSQKFAVIVVDSVASLIPRVELEGEMDQASVGVQARMMSKACRKLVGIIAESKTLVIFINQLRSSIGGLPFMPSEFTPGGKALKFYSSVRLDIRRIQQIKKGEEIVGGRVRVKVVKNKVAPPFRQTEFDLLYGEGISREGEILALGNKFGILSKAPYSYGIEPLGRGYDAARIYLRQNPSTAQKIIEDIYKAIEQEKAVDVSEDNTVVTEE